MGSPVLVYLKACAQAFRDGNLKLADQLLDRIWNPATNELESLKAESVAKKRRRCAEVLVRRAYRLYPNIPFVYFPRPHRSICEKAILSAMMGKKRVHIIDFLQPNPDDWEDIIEDSSRGSGRPSSIRLSVVALPFLKNLYATAEETMLVNVDWEFKLVIGNGLGDVEASELEFRRTEDEIVIVRYVYKLNRLLAQPEAMERELLKLRQIKPEFVITVEQDANHNDFNFVDSLESILEESESVLNIYYYTWLAMCAVECDGMNGIERSETTMAQWRSLLHAAGFLPFPLNQSSTTGVFVQEENGCLVVSVEEWPPVIISAWKFTDSVHHSISIQGSHQNSLYNNVLQTFEVLTECFTLNRVAAVAEMYDLVQYVCLKYELPLGLTWTCWANVKQLPTEVMLDPYTKGTLFIQKPACYDNDEASHELMNTCERHQFVVEGQAIAGKLLQSNESLFVQDITELDERDYPFANAARKFGPRAALAISFCNPYVGDDVYVLEFYFPSSKKNLEEPELLKDRILHDLENIQKKFVRPRVVHGTAPVGVRGEAISNSTQEVKLALRNSLPVPASTTGHNLFNSNETRSLNTTGAMDRHHVGTDNIQDEQGAQIENRRAINSEMVKANGAISPVPRTKRRKLVSVVWEHFTRFRKNGLEWAKCNYCDKDLTGSSRSGTTHLKNHLERCSSKKVKFPAQSGGASEGNSSFDQERTRLEFAKTIIKNQCLLDAVEDESYKKILSTLQPTFQLQSRRIILSDINRLYKEEKEKLRQYFGQLDSNFSLTIEFWADDVRLNDYCCLVAYFIDGDWKLKKKIIAFKILEGFCTVSEIIRRSLSEWNISKKICSITVNSSVLKDGVVEQIKEYCLSGQAFLPSGGCYIRCTLIEDCLLEIDDLLLKIMKLKGYIFGIPWRRLNFSCFDLLDWVLRSRERLEQNNDNFE
ncbi:uncharacterized protein LOC110426093 [Herrania umbratica]|uniref:Uncharacterized protein LOC110426093 n=1 Tax=Herrania umbratica TaxID=108875 RepID=A0A6J1BC83_9ROSI|nr:uncharacterized protein LOC110426093 [Herrania umbratica]